jgi:hypothetical protein
MNHPGIKAVFWTGCATLALCTLTLAQVVEQTDTSTPPRQHRLQGSQMQAPQNTPPGTAPAPAPATPPVTPTENVASAPPSLLDKPAEPAKVDLASGSLTIHADNSSLADILDRVKTDSGMAINGLGNDQRIFGSYGPGDPQDVLYALLDGSGYNVVMLGRTETGTPKELSLTPRGSGAGAGAGAGGSHHPQQQVVQDEDNDDEQQMAQPIEPPGAPQPEPPPQQNGVRTPQQMLQELQQMRQQQQLQFQQQQQQQQQSAPPPQQP